MDLSEWLENSHMINNDEGSSINECIRIKPYNMRYVSLENFPPNDRRSLNRVAAINRFKEDYLINCPIKSIGLLRKILQTKINDEINDILQKYCKIFVQPVLANIRENLKNNVLANELNINALMHQVLEEAKKMFPLDDNDSSFLEKLKKQANDKESDEINGKTDRNFQNNQVQNSVRARGRPKNNRNGISKTKTKRKRKSFVNNTVRNQNVTTKNKLDHQTGDKWDPSRLTTKTLFVLGSKANKALGFGAARGRLYSKHSDLFRYIGDHEDKEWLHKNQLMPPTGGKAYLLVKEDIIELMNSVEYKDTPGINMDDMGEGFTVPQSMIDKISHTMKSMKKQQTPNTIVNKSNNNGKQSTKISSTTMSAREDNDSVEESNLPISSQVSSVSVLSFIDNDLLSQFNEKDFLDQ